MPNNFKEDRRGGFYWFEGKPYVSVTTALNIIDKPALRYWFGREVYYAMVKNPTLAESEALSAPYKLTDKAKARGSLVHSIVETYKASDKKIETIPEEYKGYANAFYSFVADHKLNILSQENTIVSLKHGYAGTYDIVATLNGTDKIWVLDVKTGKDIYDEAFLQLSAYKQGLIEKGEKIDAIGVILLANDGKYKFEEGVECFEEFIHCKKLWEWKNREMIKKITPKGGE